jgi:hypothetical protein
MSRTYFRKLASEIRELLVAIDEVQSETLLFTALWGTSAIPGSAIVQTIRLERNPTIKEEVVTAADLDHLILETH